MRPAPVLTNGKRSITRICVFEEGGVMPGKLDVNTGDNTNVVFWVKDSTIVDGGL